MVRSHVTCTAKLTECACVGGAGGHGGEAGPGAGAGPASGAGAGDEGQRLRQMQADLERCARVSLWIKIYGFQEALE
jgi:hypothetical protein